MTGDDREQGRVRYESAQGQRMKTQEQRRLQSGGEGVGKRSERKRKIQGNDGLWRYRIVNRQG